MNSSDEQLRRFRPRDDVARKPDESHATDKSRRTKKPGAQRASQRRDFRGERAQREAAVTAPCSPRQPAGGE